MSLRIIKPTDLAAQDSEDGLLELLKKEILNKRIQPEDKYEIAAILESNGWNDERARERFGVDGVFALADDLWVLTQSRIVEAPLLPNTRMSYFHYLVMFFRSFMKGMIFALPMAISVISMLTLRFALWSYEYLTLELATSIALGTIFSFMSVGGFTQAIARRGFMYIKQGHYNMARRITFYFIKLGYLLCFVIALAFLLFNVFFSVYPFRMIIIIVLYFFFLSAIWLSVTVMYILEKELAFTGLLMAGIGLVCILFKIYHLNIILSQVLALIFVSAAGIGISLYFFVTAEKKMEKGIAPSLPRSSITVYTVLPYFTYGYLYFTFLFTDRIVAWSTNNLYMPYLIWFRGQYEMGLDIALLTVILPMGFIEFVVTEFMLSLESSQKGYLAKECSLLASKFVKIYIRKLLTATLFAICCSIGIYIIIRNIGSIENPILRKDFLANNITHFVFIWGLISYTLLTAGLMNVLILFSVSKVDVVVQSLLISLAVNIVIGFILSRWFNYHYAIIGSVSGTIVFVILTVKHVLKVLNNLDYYLYAAS